MGSSFFLIIIIIVILILLFLTSVFRAFRNFFSILFPKGNGSRPKTREEVLYNKDDIVVLKGEAKEKDNLENNYDL